MNESDYLWGAKEIADFLGCKPRHIYRNKDRLPIGRFGGKMVASRSKLEDYLEECINMESGKNSASSGG